jgi:protein TonB
MMAKKKNKKADLERKRFAFFQIGLVIAGALCLAAFEYTGIRFGELAKNETEQGILDPYVEVQTKEYIIKKETSPPKKIQKEIVLEVTPSDNPDIKPNDNISKINNIDVRDVTDWGFDEGDEIVNTVGGDTTVYLFPQIMPLFPGGVAAMKNWIASNIQLPHYAEPLNGTVYIRFVVNEKGEINNVSLGKSLHSDYDKASLAVVQKMPQWTPGEQAGKKVKVRYDLPIKFVNR